ncbi:hypothetical protein [Vandammella animalimorsus]|uniref:hypothetical protein n=1 Tax=Vandammella animalimorsus TaxID=2029117 RepID=UPI001EECFD43|nr:hypothetical protein [Vandammella animalimorsus]
MANFFALGSLHIKNLSTVFLGFAGIFDFPCLFSTTLFSGWPNLCCAASWRGVRGLSLCMGSLYLSGSVTMQSNP